MQKAIERRQALMQTMGMLESEEFLHKTIKLWEILASELTYIIGEKGVQSLLSRSIHLANAKFPWLDTFDPLRRDESRVSHLKSVFADREIAEIREVNIFIFVTFIETLESLIGEVLTASIFRSAWKHHVFQKEKMMRHH
jgi:hypothetical protein